MLLFAIIGVCFLCVLLTTLEKWTWTTLSLLVTSGIFFYINKPEAISWIMAHWDTALCFVCAYLVVGAIWSFGKWFFFLIGFRDGVRDQKNWYAQEASWIKCGGTSS